MCKDNELQLIFEILSGIVDSSNDDVLKEKIQALKKLRLSDKENSELMSKSRSYHRL